MVQTSGQEFRNGVCCVYNRRYEWHVVLYCVTIAAASVVCFGGAPIFWSYSVDSVGGVVELMLRL